MADTHPLAARPPGLLGMVQNRQWGRLFPVALLRNPIFVVAALLAIFLSYKAVHNQLSDTGILHENRVSLASFLDGSVHKPFACRVRAARGEGLRGMQTSASLLFAMEKKAEGQRRGSIGLR